MEGSSRQRSPKSPTSPTSKRNTLAGTSSRRCGAPHRGLCIQGAARRLGEKKAEDPTIAGEAPLLLYPKGAVLLGGLIPDLSSGDPHPEAGESNRAGSPHSACSPQAEAGRKPSFLLWAPPSRVCRRKGNAGKLALGSVSLTAPSPPGAESPRGQGPNSSGINEAHRAAALPTDQLGGSQLPALPSLHPGRQCRLQPPLLVAPPPSIAMLIPLGLEAHVHFP